MKKTATIISTLVLLWAATATAATITVTNTDDSGEGSLRHAVANAPDGGEVVIDMHTGLSTTINLSEEILVNKDLTIRVAEGRYDYFYLKNTNADRLFHVAPGATVVISGVIFRDGRSDTQGGAIWNEGDLTLTNCAMFASQAPTGGGIATSGMLTIENCTLSRNEAVAAGGAIAVLPGGAATVYQSTIFDNTAADGGGVAVSSGGAFTLKNSIIAGNTASGSGPNISGNAVSGGYNCIQDPAGAVLSGDTTGNLTGQDPLLTEMQEDRGGSTPTCALKADSPVIDTIPADDAPAADQRGILREGRADMGAYEYRSLLRVTNNADTGPGSFREGVHATGEGGVLRVEVNGDMGGGSGRTITRRALPLTIQAAEGYSPALTGGNTIVQETRTLRIEGLTFHDMERGIQAGVLDGQPDWKYRDLTLIDCRFSNMASPPPHPFPFCTFAPCVYWVGNGGTFTAIRCRFEDGWANSCNSGPVHLTRGYAKLEQCSFRNNSSTSLIEPDEDMHLERVAGIIIQHPFGVEIKDCLFERNSGRQIQVNWGEKTGRSMMITNCTFADNQMLCAYLDDIDSAIAYGALIGSNTLSVDPVKSNTMMITNCTFTGNYWKRKDNPDGKIFCSLINAAPLVLTNNIFTGNYYSGDEFVFVDPSAANDPSGEEEISDLLQSVVSQGNNIFTGYLGDDVTDRLRETDEVGVDPGLLPIADNGGPSRTCALGPGSIAIDRVLNASDKNGLIAYDQRGFRRDAYADAGAFEFGACETATLTAFSGTGEGSLPWLVANASNGDVLVLDSDTPIMLDEAIVVDKDITLQSGETGCEIQGTGDDRLFRVTAGHLTLDHVTLTGGQAPDGGAVRVEAGGGLTMTGCTLTGNRATGLGGAVQAEGPVSMVNCTLTGNRANRGGGLAVSGGNASLLNCTVYGNTAAGMGGGLFTAGDAPAPMLQNTIVAGNTAGSGPDISGAAASAGYNLIQSTQDAAISGDTATNRTGVDPGLLALSDNGGPTLTLRPAAGSPALDAIPYNTGGDPYNAVPDDDQRRIIRAAGEHGLRDIGAYETPEVTNLNWYGPGSLPQVLADAVPGETLFIDSPGTINLYSSSHTNGFLLNIDKPVRLSPRPGLDVTLQAAGGLLPVPFDQFSSWDDVDDVEGDEHERTRLIQVSAAPVHLENLALTGGFEQKGSGVLVEEGATLYLTGCTITGNQGTAVYREAGANLHITDCDIHDNPGLYPIMSALDPDPGDSLNFQVYVLRDGDFTLQDSRITCGIGTPQARGLGLYDAGMRMDNCDLSVAPSDDYLTSIFLVRHFSDKDPLVSPAEHSYTSDISIADSRFTGIIFEDSPSGYQAGVKLDQANAVSIADCRFVDVGHRGVSLYISHGKTVIERSVFNRSGAMMYCPMDDVRIADSTFFNLPPLKEGSFPSSLQIRGVTGYEPDQAAIENCVFWPGLTDIPDDWEDPNSYTIGCSNVKKLVLTNTTLMDVHDIFVRGLWVSGNVPEVKIANTLAFGYDQDIYLEDPGALTSLGNNRIGQTNAAASFDADGDVVDAVTDPRVSPPADNGGPVLSCALQPGSPAIDPAYDNPDAAGYDQRGYAAKDARDIGAFEYDGPVHHLLTYGAGPNGALTGQTTQNVADGGDGSQVTAVADADYSFVQWSDGLTDNPRTDTSVTAALDVRALFARNTHTLTYLADPGGSIAGLAGQSVYEGEDGEPVTAVAESWAHFSGWNDGSTDNPRTDTGITTDLSVTAEFVVNTYALAYAAGTGGSLSGDTAQTVAHGGSGTAVEAVPEAGHEFVEWSDGVTDNPRTDTNVTGDIDVMAQFDVITYTLTYTAGTGGGITGDTPQTVAGGEDGAEVTAAPDEGFEFVQWSDGVTAISRTDTNVTADIDVTAQFAIKTYTLAYTAGAGGSLSGDATQTVNHGGNGAAVTAVPDEGYEFVAWNDGVTTAARTDTNVTADLAAEAQFAMQTFTLTYLAGEHGSIDGDTSQTVDYGADGASVTAAPEAGYEFVNWSDGSTDNPRTDLDVTADQMVTAYFTTFALTVTNGVVSGDYPFGRVVTIAADAPPAGQVFDQWTGDTAQVANIYLPNTTITMPDADVAVTATYKEADPTAWTLTVNQGTGEGDYPAGEMVTLTADAPPAGQVFDQWTGNTATVANVLLAETTLVMPSAVTEVTAAYKEPGAATYALTVTSGSGSGDYLPGTMVSLNANTPPAGKVFDQWVGDTETLANINIPETTLIMPSEVASIDAVFKDEEGVTHTLTVTGGAGSGDYPAGSVVVISADILPSATFLQWTGHTAWVADIHQTDTTLIMPGADIAVTADTLLNSYTLTYSAGANGNISGSSPQTVVHGGNGTAVTAVPAAGRHFVNWSDGSTENPRTDINVTADISVTAQFAVNTYTLVYSAGDNGSISGTRPQTVVHGGNGTAVTAVPAAGSHFVNWSDGSTENPRTDINVMADLSVSATFVINTYSLNYTAGTGGSLTGTSPQTVTHGGSGTAVEAAPDAGYYFVQWSDGGTDNPRIDANVTTDISVTAQFAVNTNNTYTLTYTAGDDGTLTGAASQTVNHGENGSAVTAVPTFGYHFVQWSDGVTDNPRSDQNLTEDISVTAVFAFGTDIAGDIDSNGSLNLSDAIIGLKILTNITLQIPINPLADVNGDQTIGAEEIIYILLTISHTP